LWQSIYSGGRTANVRANGTYTVGQDCTLTLTFAPASSTGGSTGSFQAPTSFRGILNSPTVVGRTADSGRGVLIVQPANVTTVVGRFVAQ
jgi:hypothetical protein